MAKVLLVDDDVETSRTLAVLLAKYDHVIFVAENGFEATGILSSFVVDVVATDLNMPGMNGVDLCTFIKEKYQRVKTILCTSRFDRLSLPISSQWDFHGYVDKPFNVAKLDEEIQRILGI